MRRPIARHGDGVDGPGNGFSALMLDHGEYYFKDNAGTLFLPDPTRSIPNRVQVSGRLRICSYSLVFDPNASSSTIIRIPFEHVTLIEPVNSRGSVDTYLVIQTKRVIEIKKDSPYDFVDLDPRSSGEFVLTFTITKIPKVYPLLLNLHSAAGLDKLAKAEFLKELIDDFEQNTVFDPSWYVDHRERSQLTRPVLGSRVTPLVKDPGWVQVTDSALYFQPLNNVSLQPVHIYQLNTCRRLFKRRHVHRDRGIEILMDNDSLFLCFESTTDRDLVVSGVVKALGDDILGGSSSELTRWHAKWRRRLVSNYDYLMFLNHHAGRTFNDLTQYPIFPWVIKDYTSKVLDLDSPDSYRDLSKPIGALNPERLQALKKRMRELESLGDPTLKFLYGTHYSTPAYVLFFLVRTCPDLMLCLQNGKFDEPDRLFCSIAETWEGCLTSPADVKELIPQFYASPGRDLPGPGFLLNSRDLSLGCRQNRNQVGDVKLPPWSKDPDDFILKCSEALESDFVSNSLHRWIDLIFGYQNCGDEALKADNLFYYLTYDGAVDIEGIKDPIERLSIELQINEFGQTPKQLFKKPHAGRMTLTELAQKSTQQLTSEIEAEIVKREAPVPQLPGSISGHHIEFKGIDTAINSSEDEWNKFSDLKKRPISILNRGVTDVAISTDKDLVFSVSEDSFVKVFSTTESRIKRSSRVCDLALSCCALADDGSGQVGAYMGSWDNNIYLYSVAFGNASLAFSAHDDAVSCLAISDETMVSGSWDSTVKIWNVSRGSNTRKQAVATLIEHDDEVKSIAIGSESGIAASGSADGTVILWDLDTERDIRRFESNSGPINALAMTEDGSFLVAGGDDGLMTVYRTACGSPLYTEKFSSSITYRAIKLILY